MIREADHTLKRITKNEKDKIQNDLVIRASIEQVE